VRDHGVTDLTVEDAPIDDVIERVFAAADDDPSDDGVVA
jgi:hypothetical protein